MRILHAIHDFLPRHRAGSELYAYHLCRELSARHEVAVLAAEYDPERPHGSVARRAYNGVNVLEVVNNWRFATFEESYRSPTLAAALGAVLDGFRPDVLHLHNLLNLTFELPGLARTRGIPVVATVHDHTLVCASGGQRVHAAEEHVCHEIDSERCARCFRETPFYARLAAGRRALPVLGLAPVRRLAERVRQAAPAVFRAAERGLTRAGGPPVSGEAIRARLEAARRAAQVVELFVCPSRYLAGTLIQLGFPPGAVAVSPYGLPPSAPATRVPRGPRVRIGFVGTLAWHKGAHVLIEAVRALPPERFEVVLFGDPRTFPDYAADLRRRAEGLPVRFAGPFGDGEAPLAYAQIDLLVVPSLWPENAPFVVQEAFRAGVPVIASRMGGLPELVEHGANGLLYDAYSPAALAAALRPVLEEPARLGLLARGIPGVRTIADDAVEWERRYARVSERAAGATA